MTITINRQILVAQSFVDELAYYKVLRLFRTVCVEKSKYGIVNGINIEDRVYKVKGLVEKPKLEEAPSNVAILGRYILTPRIFEILENTKPGKGGEIQLTDALLTLLDEEAIYAYDFEGKRYDVGDKQGFLEATVEYALRREDLQEGFKNYLKSLDLE